MPSLRLPLDWCSSLILGIGIFLPDGSSPVRADWMPAGSPAVVQVEEPPAPAGVPGSVAAEPLFDCNENGVEDSVDIAVGTSSDANLNAVPDECEGLRNAAQEAEIGLRRDLPTSATISLVGGELSGRKDVRVEAPPHDE